MEEFGLDILHVVEACGGGVRRHLKLIMPELVKRGMRCGVFAFGARYDRDFPSDLDEFKALGCKVWSLPTKGGGIGMAWAAVRKLRRILREVRPQAMHLHSSVAGLVGRLACGALPGVKVVYSPHAFAVHPSLPLRVRVIVRIIEQWGAQRTNAYVFVGRSEINDANILCLPPEKFHLIENGLSEDYCGMLLPRDEARRQLGLAADEKWAVVPCRLAPQKGLHQVLAALERCHGENGGQLRVMFCGDGPQKDELVALAASLGVSERVSFPGVVPNLSTLLNAFDMAVLPSLYEGLSYVLLECLAAGVPLVVSDILANVPRPDLRQTLQTFEVGDVDTLAEEIEKTIGNPQWAKERAEFGVQFMKNDFRLSNQADKLMVLYNGLLRSGSKTGL
ncbi:MAG: glycosyltransferase [Victivallales bacterium]|nr:glycosyltransferase [Victivallales bacterium]MBR6059662.1 glycosyltransferase [Victivallales bacterium]